MDITIRTSKNENTNFYSADILINGKVFGFGAPGKTEGEAIRDSCNFIHLNAENIIREVEIGNINNWWKEEEERGKVNG